MNSLRNHYSKTRQKGFTLIELLIVIAIIGILASLLMVNFIGVRQRARDAQRKGDIRQIQSALELYRSDAGSYPATSGSIYYLNSGAVCPTSTTLVNGGTTYMKMIPCDPLVSGTNQSTLYNAGNYYYYSDGTNYTLVACLENSSDPQATQTAPNPQASTGGSCSYYFNVQNP